MGNDYRFGGGAAETTLAPVVLAAMVVGILLLVAAPRKRLAIPFLLLAFLIPPSQTLVLAGVHLFVVRILILAGCARLFATKIVRRVDGVIGRITFIDKVFTCWALTRALAFMLLYGTANAVINQVGFLWDSLGGYFFLRFAIRDLQDIRTATKVFALIAVITAACMLYEQQTRSNLFSLVGAPSSPAVRDGKPRSQGPFAHAILAGTFGATTIPLLLTLWTSRGDRAIAAAGVVGATTMVLTSASSTPLGAFVAGVLGICCWPLRRRMRVIRWGILFSILLLASLMKAPVWFLLARVDFVGGSSGYHRAMLVDQCIRRFGDWWLLGANNNQNWGWDMWDVQNQFVAEGLKGGLGSLVLFIILIACSFARLGNARRTVDRPTARILWLLGSVLFAHTCAFFGADYFDQTRFWWYASLAMVSTATAPFLSRAEPHMSSRRTAPTRL